MPKTLLPLLLFICHFAFSQSIVDPRTGIPIIFVEEENMFPESWYGGEINGKGFSLDTSEYERSEKMILKALSKYPVPVLTKNLKKIYIVHSIQFYGQTFGGTNSNDRVYVGNKGVEMGYTDEYLEQTFHHEFSSVLLRKYPSFFDQENWKAANSEDFSYGKGGVAALKSGESDQDFDSTLNKQGILCQYGKASVEEDFNTFAENLFLSSDNFWDIIARYERLNKKAQLIINFYKKLDPVFTGKYFEKISGK
ncbi:MAG: hypothetical protein ACJ76F_03185 [Bacteroidia bacterium]